MEAGGADVDGENQAEADQRKKAEGISPSAAMATRGGRPAGAGGSNVGAVVEAILTAGNPAAQEEIADHIFHRPEQARGMEPIERSALRRIRMRKRGDSQVYEGAPFSCEKTSLCSRAVVSWGEIFEFEG